MAHTKKFLREKEEALRTANFSIKKWNAIVHLALNGNRCSEWAEAGLLSAIVRIIEIDDDDIITSKFLKELEETARNN